jgi:putative methyltransferase (TIGR04325 family)
MRRLSALLHREDTTEMRAYDSFESALRDSDSYEDPRLIEVVKKKTLRYRETLVSGHRPAIQSRQLVQNLFVLSFVDPQRPLNVLEIGGACGASYFETTTMLPARIRHWSIVETPAMAAAGQSLNDDPKLSFHSDLASAAKRLESRDLAVAQGALQYAGNPLEVLKDIFALEPSYVYVTRTAVTNVHSPIFTKQDTDLSAHGPGILANARAGKSSQPMTLVNYDVLISAIPPNYEIVFEFDESDERLVSIAGRSVRIRDVGFLARRSDTGGHGVPPLQ